ncbi:MAG: uroporphyrinogen decarboxylase family protein [bacterium]
MTAQERFYTAVSGGRPDRVPTLPKIWVDLGAALMGIDLRDVIEDSSMAIRVVVEAALAVKADGVRLFHLPGRRTRVEKDTLVEVDENGCDLGSIDFQGGLATSLSDTSKLRLDAPYRIAFLSSWSTREPLVRNLEDVKRIAVPDKAFYESTGCGKRQREIIEEYGDRIALLGDCGSATLAFHVLLRRMDNALIDLLEQPRLAHAAMEKGAAIAIEKGKFNIDSGLNILRLNDSVANMSVISPSHWREFIFPHMKTVCEELHSYAPTVRIYCHICGNVLPIMEDIIRTGLDCIGPLDSIGGVTCAAAREAVGDRVALMGGVDTQSFVNSEPEEFIEEARRCIEEGDCNGGYILGSGCALSRNSRRDNLIALSRAAELYGVYSENGRGLCHMQKTK